MFMFERIQWRAIVASFGLRIIRTLFGMVDPIAPRLAGRVAFEVFCRTADPRKPSAAERRVLERSRDFMQEARLHRLTVGGGCVAAHEFRPASGRWSATVLVIHGWKSRTEHMRAVIDGFRNAGVRAIALDLPGHGASSGRRLNMAIAVSAVQAADLWFGPFDAMVGHSFGGAVAVNAAVGSITGVEKVRTDRLVLIAAPSSLPMIFADFGRFLNLGPRTQTAIAGIVERIAGQPLEAYAGQYQLAEHPIETLVMHAADDKEVSPLHAEGYAKAGAHVRLAWVNGLGHRRIVSDPSVVVQAVDFGLAEAVDVPAPRRAATRHKG